MERPATSTVIVKSVLILLSLVILSSCAPKKKIKPVLGPLEIKPPEEVKLPEPPQPKEKTEITKPEQPVIIEKKAEEKYIVLNFNNASLETILSTVGELLNINYVLTPGISGRITIQSYKKFPMSELFQILQTILEMNGLTAVRDGSFYRVVPLDTVKQQPVPVEFGKELKRIVEPGFITQIIPLENVKVTDAANIIRGLLPRGSDLIVYEPGNLMILTAPPHAVNKFMKILEAIDIPLTEREGMRTFVYYVENGEAKKLLDVLKTIYAEEKKMKTAVSIPSAPGRITKPGEAQTVSGEMLGDIIMTAYDDINAIIFKCTPRAYLQILDTLKKLDIPPKQVLIEVLIAEVTLDDKLQFGIEWILKGSTNIDSNRANIIGGFATDPNLFFQQTASGGTTITDLTKFTPVVSSGAFANILDPMKFNALISMLSGTSNFNVLASPHILALDNKEAKIEVGSDIPVATGLVQQPSTTGGATLVSQGQIQYRTAGIILTVTPYISDKNQVTLKINQEYSSPGAPTKIAGQEFPSFITRRANTTGIIQNGHTLLIGGLISETATKSRSGIPLLSQIPLIGWLFGSTSVSKSKTELLVMVTPHVVSTQDEADRLIEEFKERVRTINERIKERK